MSVTKTVDKDGNETIVYDGVDLTVFRERVAEEAFGSAKQVDGHCRRCKQPFTPDIVFTASGWRETAISGVCEKCFDEMYDE